MPTVCAQIKMIFMYDDVFVNQFKLLLQGFCTLHEVFVFVIYLRYCFFAISDIGPVRS